MQQTFFSHFWPFFSLLPHYSAQKLKLAKNVENTWRYYPFTHEYHKWRSYDIWFLRHKTKQTKFLSFWAISCPLILLTTWKSNEKRHLEVLSFYTFAPHMTTIIWCMVSEIWSANRIFSHSFFKLKCLQKWKKCWQISFYTCVPKIMIRWCTAPEMCCATNRLTDARMEKVT